MADDVKNQVPEAVRKILGAIVNQAVARCHRQGIALRDFYRALLEEQKAHPTIPVTELFERTFQRLRTGAN